MKERLSAAMDGDRSISGAEQLIEKLGTDSELRERWEAYCLIGDTLRGEHGGDGNVLARVMSALEEEPTMLAPNRAVAPRPQPLRIQKLLPIAASLLGVAAVGWMAASIDHEGKGENRGVQPVASLKAPPGAPARIPVPASAVDPVREYVFFHQASSRSGPLPGIAPYVRSVSEVPSDSGR